MPNISSFKNREEYNEYFRKYWSTRKRKKRLYDREYYRKKRSKRVIELSTA